MKTKNTVKNFAAALAFIMCIALSVEDIKAINTDELITDLKSRDSRVRMEAVEELGKDIDKNTLDVFKKYIFVKYEDWRIKTKAIDILGTVEDREVSDFLIKIARDPFLNEGCPAIKRHAIIALGKRFNNGTKAVNALVKALQEDNVLVKEAAVQSLGEIGDSMAVPFLIQGLDSESFAIRLSTIRALEKIGDIQAVPYLKRYAGKEKDPYLKEMASSLVENFSSWIIFTGNKDLKE